MISRSPPATGRSCGSTSTGRPARARCRSSWPPTRTARTTFPAPEAGRWKFSFQYRILRQTGPVRFSSLTGWEAPDPAWWVSQGYAVVNCDLRGAGTSDGTGSLMSDQEGEDIHDLIEWAGAQPWSTGSVGLLGVSYLAVSQWKAAATQPPSLKAIAPWEGFSNAYRGLLRPGGVPEVGFLKLWNLGMKKTRQSYSLLEESAQRPVIDDWWRSLVPDLAKIEVPALICGSFSDNNLHSRGSIAAFERISSTEQAPVHPPQRKMGDVLQRRGARRRSCSSSTATCAGVTFPPCRRCGWKCVTVAITSSRSVTSPSGRSRARDGPRATYQAPGLAAAPSAPRGTHLLRHPHAVPPDSAGPSAEDIELTGPMALRLFVEVAGADDADLVVGVEKWNGNHYVGFEGSYGYGRDRVATGWQNVALRELDEQQSRPFEPVAACLTRKPVNAGRDRTRRYCARFLLNAVPRRRTDPARGRRPLAGAPQPTDRPIPGRLQHPQSRNLHTSLERRPASSPPTTRNSQRLSTSLEDTTPPARTSTRL